MYVATAFLAIWFFGLVLWMGIQFNSVDNPLWWLALVSVIVLVVAFVGVNRRLFR
jgi:hypothetical protein